jgi:glycosyltransferase involved in cell wall biosynthesis
MPTKKIKTLWLPSWYPHAGHPLLGNFTRRDAEAVAPFAEVVVLYVVEAKVKNRLLRCRETKSGITETIVTIPKSRCKVMRLLRLLGAYRMGWEYLATKGFYPDLIHLHVVLPAGIGALYLKWKLGVPMVISEHWSEFLLSRPKASWFHKWILKNCTQKSSAIFTVTPAMADGMKRLGAKGNFIANPNVVDVENAPFRHDREEGTPFRFVHVSSLADEHKNISGILQAFQMLAAIRQDFRLEIIGGDEGNGPYEALAMRLGLENLVCFRGRLPHREVMQRLADSDAFVLFSNREGLPCVLLEAMAVGLPVISTDLPGLAEWITQERGIRIPIGDVEKLHFALQEMMSKIGEFDGQKIREFIAARCSYEVVGGRIYKVYKEVLAQVNASL